MKPFVFSSRKKWREWLQKNHDSKTEVWIEYYKKATGKQTLSYEDALNEALCFGWIDGKLKSLDSERYMLRFTPRGKASQWSSQNVARYKKLLKEGLVTEAGKKAFSAKGRVYTPVLGKKSYEWHLSHRMPKNPTVVERISWHLEHQKNCNCRPIPNKLQEIIRSLAI